MQDAKIILEIVNLLSVGFREDIIKQTLLRKYPLLDESDLNDMYNEVMEAYEYGK